MTFLGFIDFCPIQKKYPNKDFVKKSVYWNNKKIKKY